MTKYVDSNNSNRPTGDYSKIISQIAKDGVCPFCEENLVKYHKNSLEKKRYWTMTDNMYPYKPSLHHKLFIHRTHITNISQISTEAWQELYNLYLQEITDNSIEGGTLAMRFGDTRFTGASVSHLHAHLIQSNPDDPDYEKTKGLIMRIG